MITVADCGRFNSRKETESSEQIYATVNNTSLTESELQALVPKEFYDNLDIEYKKEIVKEWVNNELLYQEALRIGIDKEPEIERILRHSKRDLLCTEILERKLATAAIPDEEELKKYYEEHKDYFILQSDEYRVSYALFDNMTDARNFWRKVKNGESFSRLASEQSLDLSARSGGEIGIVNEESVEPSMWTAIVNTFETRGLLEISDPFSVIDGLGMVIIRGFFKKGTLMPFDNARKEVYDLYIIEKREETKKALLEKLKRDAQINYSF